MGESYAEVDVSAWRSVVDDAREVVRAAPSLESAMQAVCRVLGERFSDTTALVRGYALLDYDELEPAIAAFVTRAAEEGGRSLGADTPVLTLLGSWGSRPEWCDRRRSEGHVGIPLLSGDFVGGIPMVARLLVELGVELSWLDDVATGSARKLAGGFNGTFYVADARREKDGRGRFVIPARAFVVEERVESVFGVGGFYPNGTLVVFVVFAREHVPQRQADSFQSLITMFKGETFGLAREGRIFG